MSNRIKVESFMKPFELLPLKEIALRNVTKGELFQGVNVSFDSALPESWLKSFSEWLDSVSHEICRDIVRSTTVWVYPSSRPCTRCQEVYDAFMEYERSI